MKTLRAYILRQLLRPDQLALLAALDAPDRWQPDPPITAADAAGWRGVLESPIGQKIDHAMINWLQQEAQRAIYQPTPDLVRSAGYAAGCRAGWLMAKSISRNDAPLSVDPEQTSPTADAHLDHHQP
jgi:hypothetical protein